MIVVDEQDRRLLIAQTDHAHLSGALLSVWKADGLPSNPRRQDLLFAARHHDDGWWEEDAKPLVDPSSGTPYSFLNLPTERRIAIWERGTERYRGERPYAAALIYQHAIELHRRPAEDHRYDDFLERARRSRDELLQEIGADLPEILPDYELLRLVDIVSLAACRCFGGKFVRGEREGWLENGTLHLEPFPLEDRRRFEIPCRQIPRRAFVDDADLAAALADSRWEVLRVSVDGFDQRR